LTGRCLMPTTTDEDRFRDEVIDEVRQGLDSWIAVIHRSGRRAGERLTPKDLAARMLAAVPSPQHPWDEQIGPFYDTPGLCRLLEVSKQALHDRVKRGTLLAVTSRNGKVGYPAFQFAGNQLLPGIREALGAFRNTPVDGWAIGAWFTTPAATLGKETPARWLAEHHDIQPVIDLARDTAARWAG
jgi:hypothetical protein